MLTLSNNFVTKAISIELTDIIVECTNKQTHVELLFWEIYNIHHNIKCNHEFVGGGLKKEKGRPSF